MTGLPPELRPRDPSWWLAEALALEGNPEPAPRLAGRTTADVLIVGGGLAGLWTANALKDRRPELDVALIEADVCGAGASGKNGGMVSGYAGRVPALAEAHGREAALHMLRRSEAAQDMIRDFAATNGTDLWMTEAGSLRIATHPDHDATLATIVADAERHGLSHTARLLSAGETRQRCDLPSCRGAVFHPGGGNIHPARLTRALRRSALGKGVRIFEKTRFTGLERGTPNRVTTDGGEVTAREVVLAMNTGLTLLPELRRHVSMLSSYVLMTEPVPELLEQMNWTGQEGLMDMRAFMCYARKTPDDRVLVGWTGGPIGYGSRYRDARLRESPRGAEDLLASMRLLLPALAEAPVARIWGGGIDLSFDRLPFIRTLPGTRVHVAGGFSGNGVNATCVAGQTLASLVLGQRDDWTASALVTRPLKALPPEPLRYTVARAVRWGILSGQRAREAGRRPHWPARTLAALPQLLGMKLGNR